MTELLVEISGENPELATAELDGALEALGGPKSAGSEVPMLRAARLPDRVPMETLARRLALARRIIAPHRGPAGSDRPSAWLIERSGPGRRAAFRPIGSARGSPSKGLLDPWVEAWRSARGTLDLDSPTDLFLYDPGPPARIIGTVEASVDRSSFQLRGPSKLPFRRPVTLTPRLARVLVNLARVRAGDRVVDPFVGTGGLLLEAALLGASCVGLDRDAAMVRGTLANFAHLRVEPEALRIGDAEALADGFPKGSFHALVTDPPYGRASGTGGERPPELLARVLRAWQDRIGPGGCVAVVVPGGDDPLPPPWVRSVSIRDRVHRSLTREFRVYRRASELPEAPPVP